MQNFRPVWVAWTAAIVVPVSAANARGDTDVAAVMAPINALVAGVSARNSSAVASVLRTDGEATVVAEKPDGTIVLRHPTWPEFLGGIKPGPEKFEPRLKNPIVQVDGNMATAWTPYTFFIDRKVHHCGVNQFDLIRENGSWKILNVTYTIRTVGCSS